GAADAASFHALRVRGRERRVGAQAWRLRGGGHHSHRREHRVGTRATRGLRRFWRPGRCRPERVGGASRVRAGRLDGVSFIGAASGDRTRLARRDQHCLRLPRHAAARTADARNRSVHRASWQSGGGGAARRLHARAERAAHRRTVAKRSVAGVLATPGRRSDLRGHQGAVRPGRNPQPGDIWRALMSIPDVVPAECALPGSPLAGERAGIDACVHCGFCLQACPTYVTLEDENDSPRGRIVLMRALLEGTLAPSDTSVETHIAQCLGCRACETVCPSGVPYGHLLEATRATLAEHRPIPFVARVILSVFERPAMLAAAMALGRATRALRISRLLAKLPGRFGFSMAMLESTRRAPQLDRRMPAAPPRPAMAPRGSTALLTGCVMEGLFAETNRATERVLRANGYTPCDAPDQVCCGALHAHA